MLLLLAPPLYISIRLSQENPPHQGRSHPDRQQTGEEWQGRGGQSDLSTPHFGDTEGCERLLQCTLPLAPSLSLFSFIRSLSWSGRFLCLICCSQSAAPGERSAGAKSFLQGDIWLSRGLTLGADDQSDLLSFNTQPPFFWMTRTNSIHSEKASTVGTI